MLIYIEEELSIVEQSMIEHFEENEIGHKFDISFLENVDLFPQINDLHLDEDFVKWFHIFQGKYIALTNLKTFLNS